MKHKKIIPLLALGLILGTLSFVGGNYFQRLEASSTSRKTPTEQEKAAVMELMGPVTDPYKGDYYNGITASSGYSLKTQLFNLIKNHDVTEYGSMEVILYECDKRPDGTMWDYYGDYSFAKGDVGNYSVEGDTWNKEHSIPQSWFNEASPMKSDAYHIYVTDGKINGARSNYPFGEVTSVNKSWTQNRYLTYDTPQVCKLGSGKIGDSSSTTVFEPADCYKGDFARTYFYFVTRYQDKVSSFAANGVFSGDTSTNFNLTANAKKMFLKWHQQDPVSQREVQRCNAIYSFQKNRNPFIDHPEYVEAIWGDSPISTKELTKLEKSGNPAKTTYKEGELFDSTGLTVTATFDDGTSENVTSKVTWNPSTMIAGTTSVTGTYKHNSVSKSITVNGLSVITLQSLSCTGTPIKTTYEEGESFNPTGLTVTANYSDGNTSNVTSQVQWTPKPLTLGTTSVTGSYGGKTIVINGITVVEGSSKIKLITANSQLSDGDRVYIGLSGTELNDTPAKVGNKIESNWIYCTSYSESGTGYLVFTVEISGSNYYLKQNSNYIYCSAAKKIDLSSNKTAFTIQDLDSNRTSAIYFSSIKSYLCQNASGLRPYSSTSNYEVAHIYKLKNNESLNAAKQYAQHFISSISCDATGASKPSFTNSESWSSLGNQFEALSNDAQVYLLIADYVLSGSVVTPLNGTDQDIANCVARYDLIVRKYGNSEYSNFMNRTIDNSRNISFVNNASAAVAILIIASVIVGGILTFAIFFSRKKYRN